ncbi:MAG: hypothetical protein R6U91_05760 [Bacillota bacterium]
MENDLASAGILLAYYLIIVALLPVFLKYCFKVQTEYIRKTHHMAYSFSIFLLLNLFSTWYYAVGAAFLLMLLGYPFLLLVENTSFYRSYFVDRTKGKGELRKQLIYVQSSFALLIFIFWGLLGADWQYIAAVAVMGWGFGDAAAALAGKYFGKRRMLHRYIEKAKTFEGTIAMITAAGLATFFTLLFYAGLPWLQSLLIALVAAPVCGIVELFSKQGSDTLTVPLSASAVIIPMVHFFSILGW